MVTVEEFAAGLQEKEGGRAGAAAPPGAALPKGLEQIVGGIDKFMPVLEQLTGKSRAKLTAEFGWAVAHNKVQEFIGGLIPGMGADNAPPVSKKSADFVYYLRAVGIWIPLLVLFFGVVVIVLIGLFRLMMGVT
jgi:hypothetical protein